MTIVSPVVKQRTIAAKEDKENTDTEITVKEDAPKAEYSIDIEYSSTFSEGLKRIVKQTTETVSDGWTGGAVQFYTPLKLALEIIF